MMWRIYYAGGTTHDGTAADVPSVRTTGVQVIVQFDPYTERWYLQHTSDNYVWKGDRWLGVDDTGRTVYLVEPGWKRVLFGETIRNQEWLAIYQEAKAYRDQLNRDHVRP